LISENGEIVMVKGKMQDSEARSWVSEAGS